MQTRTINRSHTKSGPGRTHGQCKLIVDPQNGNVLGVRSPSPTRSTANYGGNWQGKEYLTYREHDLVTRLTFSGPNQMHRGEAEAHVKSLRPSARS
jgi:hypothetical protein